MFTVDAPCHLLYNLLLVVCLDMNNLAFFMNCHDADLHL